MTSPLLTADFDYMLPPERIAQEPLSDRDTSRLMVIDRHSGRIEHTLFANIGKYFNPGDALVINTTKVIPARLNARRKSGGQVEIFLLQHLAENRWEALLKPARRIHPGESLLFESSDVHAVILETKSDGSRIIEFQGVTNFFDWLDKAGRTPLPPYIKRPVSALDNNRYQTVFADQNGAVAAPTAGLHFTPDLLNQLMERGIAIVRVLLHVGLGTFRPVQTERIQEHQMHPEFFAVSPDAAEIINSTRRNGNRIIATGTTSVRALESAAHNGNLKATSDWTRIFIFPSYQFKIIDCLITNFHLPKSTLLMLVCAFANRELILRAYHEAIEEKYRFFSYGDAMLIL